MHQFTRSIQQQQRDMSEHALFGRYSCSERAEIKAERQHILRHVTLWQSGKLTGLFIILASCVLMSRAQVVSLLLVVSWFIWGVIYSQLYATVCPPLPAPNALCMWLRRLIKASRQSEHGDDLARENPSIYFLAKSLGTMGTHYNLNMQRQRQVMISSLFIGFTFSIRAILTAVLAVGNSSSNSYFPAKPDFNTTSYEVPFRMITLEYRAVFSSRGRRLGSSSVTKAISLPSP